MKGSYNSVEQTLNTYRRKLDCSISKNDKWQRESKEIENIITSSKQSRN